MQTKHVHFALALIVLSSVSEAEVKSSDDLLADARNALKEKTLEVPDPTNAAVLKQHNYIFVEFYEPDSSKILVRFYFDKSGQRYPLVDDSGKGRVPPIVQSMDVSQYPTADSLWDQIQKLVGDGSRTHEKWPQLFHATSEFLMRYPHDPRRWEATDLWLCNGPFMDEKLAEKFFSDVREASDASPTIKARAQRWEEKWRENERKRRQ